jgi:hypothetical protein
VTAKLPPESDEYDVMELGLAEIYRQYLSSDFITLRDHDRTVMAIKRMYSEQIQSLLDRAAQNADAMHHAYLRLPRLDDALRAEAAQLTPLQWIETLPGIVAMRHELELRQIDPWRRP